MSKWRFEKKKREKREQNEMKGTDETNIIVVMFGLIRNYFIRLTTFRTRLFIYIYIENV